MTNCPHPTVMRRRQWPFKASSPNRSSRLMLDDAALVAPHHSAVSGGSSNVRTANRFLRRELANARMKPPRPTGAWPARPRTPFCARSSSTVDDIGSEPEFLALYAAFSRLGCSRVQFSHLYVLRFGLRPTSGKRQRWVTLQSITRKRPSSLVAEIAGRFPIELGRTDGTPPCWSLPTLCGVSS